MAAPPEQWRENTRTGDSVSGAALLSTRVLLVPRSFRSRACPGRPYEPQMVIEEKAMLLRKSGVFVAATCLFIGTFGQAVSGADEMTIEEYIEAARPYLHHSCQSAWAASNESPD